MDAITALKADHKKAKKLLDELAHTTERGIVTRMRLLQEIEAEINTHMVIEEEIFYPAFREAAKKRDDSIMYLEAHEEHDVATEMLVTLRATDPGSQEFGARAKVLKELVEHHIDEEEKEMFPRARALFTQDHLTLLGRIIVARREELNDPVLDIGQASTVAAAAKRVR